MKRSSMSVKQLRMTDYYWAIVPTGTKDLHAAGYDGNAFATKHCT